MMNYKQLNNNRFIRLFLACILTFATTTCGVSTAKEKTRMVKQLSMSEITKSKNLDLGVTEWRIIQVPGTPPAKDTIILGGGIQPDPASQYRKEFDPFMVMTLIPQLMPELLEVTGVTENVAVGVERADFNSSFKPGSRVRMRGMLISGEITSEGYLLYRVGASIEVSGEAGYSVVAEVLFLAGNP